MHRQIDENIDFILADQLSHFLVTCPTNVSPLVGARAKLSRGPVGNRDIGVTDDFKILPITRCEERRREKSLAMVVEIGRHIANPQTPCGYFWARYWLNELSERLSVSLIPEPLLSKNTCPVKAGTETE
jgi:hypothetical protein